MQCGLVGDGKLVRSHGQVAPVLDPIDASLDSVALLYASAPNVGGRPRAAPRQAVADLVDGLRDDCADVPPAEMPTDCARGVRAICKNGLWPRCRSPKAGSRQPDDSDDRLAGPGVSGLAGGDVEGQRTNSAVARRVAFCAQARTGTSEYVTIRLGVVGRPFSLAPAMLVSPAHSGVHRHRPAHFVVGVSCGQDSGEDTFPGAVNGPSDQSLVGRLERSQLGGQAAPWRASAVLPGDGLKGPAVVCPPPLRAGSTGITGSIRAHVASVITHRTGTSDQPTNPSKRHAPSVPRVRCLGWGPGAFIVRCGPETDEGDFEMPPPIPSRPGRRPVRLVRCW